MRLEHEKKKKLPRVIAKMESLWKSKVRDEFIAESETAVTLK